MNTFTAASIANTHTMSVFNQQMSTRELLQVAADYSQKKITLSDEKKQELVALLKQHAEEELDYGQELECETVRLVRRVTGAVSVFFT